jgi:prephenate dehydrogenase
MAVKKRNLAGLVVGVARKDRTLKEAFRKKAIDVGLLDAKEAVRGSDLVILSKPISGIVDQLKSISGALNKNTLVIDVGSSKEVIVATARQHLKGKNFVGCHPMAGSEKTGVKHAEADLFERSVCFITSPNKRVKKFWRALGARPILIDAKSHDRWVAKANVTPQTRAFRNLPGFPNPAPNYGPTLFCRTKNLFCLP